MTPTVHDPINLDSHPFSKLRLAEGEIATWKAHNPTFHRSADYGIVLSEQALHLYSPFWLSFARWRRIPLNEIRHVAFKDSRFFPSLRVESSKGEEVLRTPWDYEDEMDYDRENLKAAVIQISALLSARALDRRV